MTALDYNTIVLTGLNTLTFFKDGIKYNDAYILKGADGLGPPEIDVSIARQPNQGGYFQNKVPQNKQIIIRVGLNPYWPAGGTPAELRDEIYGTLTGGYTGDRVAVALDKHDLVTRDYISTAAFIYGYVSKVEIVPFSKDPQVQITVECLSPYLQGPETIYPTLASLSKSAPAIDNVGQAPTGFYMKLTFSGLSAAIPSWQLTSQGGLHFFKITPPTSFNNGDSIEFNSTPGSRFITIHLAGTDKNGLAYMSGEWPMLYGGMNNFTTSDSNFNWNGLNFVPQFWGV